MVKKIIGSIVKFFLLLLLLFALAKFGILILSGLNIFPTRAEQKLWRERSKSIVAEIQLGSTRDEVIQTIGKYNWWDDKTWKDRSEIRLYTPIEFGALNWIVLFEFSDDKLSSVRVRTKTSPDSKHQPKGAHEDKTL
jgi:hypothetical protein